MDSMKINYRKGGSGIRTSITLSSALIDTWFVARGWTITIGIRPLMHCASSSKKRRNLRTENLSAHG